jgi:hypothetical protein
MFPLCESTPGTGATIAQGESAELFRIPKASDRDASVLFRRECLTSRGGQEHALPDARACT